MMKTILIIPLGAAGVGCLFLFIVAAPDVQPPARPAQSGSPTATAAGAAHRHSGQTADGSGATSTLAGAQPATEASDCTVEYRDFVTPSGETFSAYTCNRVEPPAPHPYAHYDNASLAVMAYSDAAAAALLGQRLIRANTERSYDLLLRAAALDGGNVRYLAWLSDQAFGTVAIDGVPQIANLMRQYELAELAVRLGDTSPRSAYLRTELVRVGLSNDEFATLDARVDTLLLAMRDIQQAVQGEITVGGASDA